MRRFPAFQRASIPRAASAEIESRGEEIGDTPAKFRRGVSTMPYGGVKDSGLGRKGPRYTIEEMTELKLMVINRL